MKRRTAGFLLILMMLGHNYVINQPQSLQKQIQIIHQINVTQFNLLYSIPSILALITIIPIGVMYHKFPNFTLIFGVTVLLMGQLLASIFGSEGKPYYFSLLIAGRTFEGTGAEILYMIQGNLASSWMDNLAGLIFILPEVGEIMNAFFTPYASTRWGVQPALLIGVIFCLISFTACWYLYFYLKRFEKSKKNRPQTEMIDTIITSKSQQNQSNTFHSELSQNQNKINDEIKMQSPQKQKQSTIETSDQQLRKTQIIQDKGPSSILKAGKVFWLTIVICAINQCLYFPFLDNANELIQMRFKIPYQNTGYYLCLPFIAAIITTIAMSKVLLKFERHHLIFYTSLLPFLGHLIILALPNAEGQQTISASHRFILALGFFMFGTGIGGYYSVSFPAVGLAVPSKIRGLAYGVLCFFQALAMTLIPLLSGLIIEQDTSDQISGYRNNSIMFVILTFVGSFIAYWIKVSATAESFIYNDDQDHPHIQLMQTSKENIPIKTNQTLSQHSTSHKIGV